MLRTVFVTVLILVSAPAAWADAGTPPDPAARISQMLDMRSNTAVIRDPELALGLMDAMSEPEFLIAALSMSATPETWLKAMQQAGSPDVPQNLMQMADPAVISEWFYTSIDPQYQKAIVTHMMDPGKPLRWMQTLSNPRFYMNALAVMNPAVPMQWMKVTADGRMIPPMQVWLNPKTYMNWMRLPVPQTGKRGDKTPPAHGGRPLQRY